MIEPALPLIDFSSIAAGIEAADAMAKRAQIDVIRAGTVQPGRYLVLIGGTVADVEESLAAGRAVAGPAVLDHVFLPHVHPEVVAAIGGGQCLVNQREVGPHTLSFQNALRSALREDPDVILVGEMRDLETIRLAMTAAETGHLVFGTLHTSSAAKTIDRIIDVFPADEKEMVRAMPSESLRAVISQTLLKTKDGSGRVAAHEIMICTPAIRNLIREAKVPQMYSAIQTGGNLGMQTLDQCLQNLVKGNMVSSRGALQGDE